MYKVIKPRKTTLKVNQSKEGETIETKVNRIVNNKEPIKDGAPLIYTERKDGINPSHDIRTDRWDIAADAMDKTAKNRIARREGKADIGKQAMDGMKKENTGGESIQGTDK